MRRSVPSWLLWYYLGQVLWTLPLFPASVGARLLRQGGGRLIPLLAVWPAVAVTTGLAFAAPRYRVPMDVTVIILASVAFGQWLQQNHVTADSPDKHIPNHTRAAPGSNSCR